MGAICRRRPCAVVPRDLVARIRELTIAANELERRIATQVGVLALSCSRCRASVR
jgi:hypothetical protein